MTGELGFPVNHKGLCPSQGRVVCATGERKSLLFGNVTHYFCFLKHTEVQPEREVARGEMMTL